MMNTALTVLFWIAMSVGAVLLVRNYRRNARAHRTRLETVSLSPHEIETLSTELLEYVREETNNPGELVPLRDFWEARRALILGDRFATVQPLLKKRVFLVKSPVSDKDKDKVTLVPYNFTESFATVPTAVALSDKHYQLMIWDHVSPRQIIADIKGDFVMRDQYHISGQVGAVVAGARADNMSFVQFGGEVPNAVQLAHELAQLRAQLRSQAADLEHDEALGVLAAAQRAAEEGDAEGAVQKLSAMRRLKTAGPWAVGAATSVGTGVVAGVLKNVLGV